MVTAGTSAEQRSINGSTRAAHQDSLDAIECGMVRDVYYSSDATMVIRH